ncbi:MAG: hypothetical protein CMN76_05045 [Spirochaetaceae bacterium]|nr:hypothetical protein [Spirochaetaceae bacterium]
MKPFGLSLCIVLALAPGTFRPGSAAPYPPGLSEFDLRITNRRFVSHIVFEVIESRNAITLILSHGPNYNAYKAVPHSVHFFCGSGTQCLQLSRRIDRHLRSGYNLGINLQGSRIRRLEFLRPE